MDLWDVDAWQREIYERAGFDPDEAASPIRIAKGSLGPDGVRVVPHSALPNDAKLAMVNGRRFIFLRKGLPRERLLYAIAHELAELVLHGQVDERIEDACNAIAGAVLAPRRAFFKRLREVGRDFEQLALPFGMTQTASALRLGETTDEPLVAVSPVIVRVRGRDFGWPSEPEIRRIARGPERPGVRKVPLTDDRRRVVLIGEEIEDLG